MNPLGFVDFHYGEGPWLILLVTVSQIPFRAAASVVEDILQSFTFGLSLLPHVWIRAQPRRAL
jgi:hypothetical protein